jgi:hypothetical protein
MRGISDILAVEPFRLPDRTFPDPAMHSNTAPGYATVVKSFALAAGLALAGCSETNLVRDAVVAVGAGPNNAQTPDFVQQTRPERLDYVPVGTAAPARPTPARTAEEVKAAEAEMEATRLRNEQAAQAALAAGSTPPPAPVKLPKGAAKPATSAAP